MDDYEKTRKLSNLLYVVFIITTCYSVFVSSQILVNNDPSATIENIYAKEFLFRSGLVLSLVTSIIFIVFLIFIIRLFRQLKDFKLKVMILLIVSQIPISFFVSGLLHTAAVIKNDFFTPDSTEKINQVASQMLWISSYINVIEEIEWGIWLIPFAIIVYVSDFIPRIYGVLLLIGGVIWIMYCVSFFLFPQYHDVVSLIAIPCGIVAEVSFTLWFMIKGFNEKELSAN